MPIGIEDLVIMENVVGANQRRFDLAFINGPDLKTESAGYFFLTLPNRKSPLAEGIVKEN